MGAGASTQDRSLIREKLKSATTADEKIAIVDEIQKLLLNQEREKAACTIQAAERGRAERKVAKKGDDLKSVFAKFANYGKSSMQKNDGQSIDSTHFRKMLKDSKLIHNKKFNGNACDTMHVSCRKKGEKTLDYTDFVEKVIPKLAEVWGVEPDEIVARITNGGPKCNGTKAGFSKFYDDKTTWTGVATRGGPSTNDNRITLSTMMDRSPADARGIGANSGR